jgi:hypothetical protein
MNQNETPLQGVTPDLALKDLEPSVMRAGHEFSQLIWPEVVDGVVFLREMRAE